MDPSPGTGCGSTRYAAIAVGALGDFLLTLPLLVALRRRGPVAILTRGAYRALLPDALADAPVIDLDQAHGTALFSAGPVLHRPLLDCLAGAQVHAFMNPDSILADNLLRAGARGLVWHNPRPLSPPHVAARYFSGAGFPVPVNLLTTPTLPRQQRDGDSLWVHAGSGSAAKSIAPTSLAAWATASARLSALDVIVSFGEADLHLVEPIREAFREEGMPYAEVVCPSLRELRAMLASRAARYMGADTGVTHLAAALGIPVMALFVSTDPDVWRPLGQVKVVQVPRAS